MSPKRSKIIRELRQQRFGATEVDRKLFFVPLSRDFEQIFGKIDFIRVKTLSIQIWWRQCILKEKNAHFRLTFVVQKRLTIETRISVGGK